MTSKFLFNSESLCRTSFYKITRLTFNAYLLKLESVRREITVSTSYYPPLWLTLQLTYPQTIHNGSPLSSSPPGMVKLRCALSPPPLPLGTALGSSSGDWDVSERISLPE